MIRSLQLLDLARWTVRPLKNSSRVYTLDSLCNQGSSTLSRLEVIGLVSPPKNRGACSLVWLHDGDFLGLASARRRSGPGTWEFAQLVLDSDHTHGSVDLLRQVWQAVARRGGERIFIRLRRDDPLVNDCRLTGFVKSTRELLYKGRRRSTSNSSSVHLRRRKASDEYGLFRLYNASTPSEVRSIVGMTFEQWRSSLERSRRRSREFVYEKDGQVRGSLRAIQHSGATMLSIMSHPDLNSSTEALLDFGLERLASTDAVYCLIAQHQVQVERLLFQRGFEVAGDYVTFVRSMVATARSERARGAIPVSPVSFRDSETETHVLHNTAERTPEAIARRRGSTPLVR